MTVSILLFLPVIAALVVLLLKNEAVKHVALGFAVIELIITGLLISQFKADSSVQFAVDAPWLPKLGIYFSAGIDGISMIMVILTTLMVPIIILSTYTHQYKNANVFYALMLFMQAGLLVVFTALDGFLFYVGWEAALIPIYFICAMWGGRDRIRVNIKFFIYTFAGSLFMLVAIIYLHLVNPSDTYDIREFYNLRLDGQHQGLIFWAFFLAFAVKIPIFPFHTWQPDTYTEAPTGGTMMLSGIMLKMGLYGLIRLLIPITPIGFEYWGNLALILSIAGIVYASIIAFKQKDGKRLLAYSSLAHVGLIAAGIFAWTSAAGLQGAVIQMLSHGITVVGMFFIMDIIERRMQTRELDQLGGIARVAPKLAIAFLIVMMGSVALPLTSGFIGEFLLLSAVFKYCIEYVYGVWFFILPGLTVIFGAVYMLRMYKRVMQGETNTITALFTDIKGSEVVVLSIICFLVIAIGVYPQPVLHISQAAVNDIFMIVKGKLTPASGFFNTVH
jgi:NADH-quinone oxidoreductase subunit M